MSNYGPKSTLTMKPATESETKQEVKASVPAVQPPNKPEEPKKPIFLRATKYDIVDPTSGVRVHSNQDTRVALISPWLRAQIKIGLVKIVEL